MAHDKVDDFLDKEKRADRILDLVKFEFFLASRKFPPFHSTHEGYAVLREELDELWDEVKDNNVSNACKEAYQVAAMAIRFIFDCDKTI